ncbi:MAG: competence protein ComEA [Chloroflexi bacterium HGW-Chloroflexi-6]|nr:MAG: competence protein ComEA [Chloroflexi bacterium HGW-Chloroflexi-6]
MKRAIDVIAGILVGLLAAAALFLSARAPAGQAVQLLPTVSPEPMVIYVIGAVERPGVYVLPADSRVLDAVEAAGGFSEFALLDEVNVATRLSDGQKLEIPASGEVATPAFVIGSSGLFETPTPVPGDPVNINTADLALLDSLPGIGPTTAQRIIDYRETNGLFQIVDDLLKVPGIGSTTLEELRPLITVGDDVPTP